MIRVNGDTKYGTGAPGDIHFRSLDYAPLRVHPRHCHESPSITLILAGALEEGFRSGTHHSAALSVVVKPAGVYHENQYGPQGTRTFQVAFSNGLAAEWCPKLEYAWHTGGPIARAMLATLELDRAGKLAASPDRENSLAEVLAAVAESPTPDRDVPRWLDGLAHELDERATDTISIAELADDARVHPVSLARAFRRHHGCSITEYIRRRRIVNACRTLDDTLADVAIASGFADQPHFTRAFKTETGLTPGRYRSLAN